MTPPPDDPLLTISDLSQRTGVPPATLRSWEARYGFPHPTRLAGGHRRYAEQDVASVLDVVRHRDAGLALEVAVRRATTEPPQSRSLFAELRRRHPELAAQPLTKASLLALSRAVEDECCARAEQPLLFGGFQRDTFLQGARGRWVELARTARSAVVFGAASDGPAARGAGSLVEVVLPHEAPLNREWLVLCDAPDLPACMVAVERPGQGGVPDARRRFETVWTVDPRAVRSASRVAAALADEYRPGWRGDDLELLDDEPPAASPDLRRATGLLDRTLAYLDARH